MLSRVKIEENSFVECHMTAKKWLDTIEKQKKKNRFE